MRLVEARTGFFVIAWAFMVVWGVVDGDALLTAFAATFFGGFFHAAVTGAFTGSD